MNKTLPALFVAGSVGLAQVCGPHDPHVEPNIKLSTATLVGAMATEAVYTATSQVIWNVDAFIDFR